MLYAVSFDGSRLDARRFKTSADAWRRARRLFSSSQLRAFRVSVARIHPDGSLSFDY
jgi:hypothetical protein